MFLYFGLSNMVNSLTYTVIGINVLMTNWLIIIFGGLFVLLIGTLFGVLPIILLLRKTPSEIMSKYDI
jgi:ABC-type antimicrobial peptide transport system permease subunit